MPLRQLRDLNPSLYEKAAPPPVVREDFRSSFVESNNLPEDVREIPLSKGEVAFVSSDFYDYVSSDNWHVSITSNLKYAERRRKEADLPGGQKVYMHVAIMERVLGRPLVKGEEVDHKDHNGLNNVISNLRIGSKSDNMRNQRLRVDTITGYKGVSSSHKMWDCKVFLLNECVYRKRFMTKEEAAYAYNIKAKEFHGTSACINILPDGWVPPLGFEVEVSDRKHNNNSFTGKIRGAYKNGSKFKGQLTYNGVVLFLGNFNTKELAARAYDKKVLELYGEDTHLNFPIEDYIKNPDNTYSLRSSVVI